MVGRALVHRAVHGQLSEHVFHAVASGSLPPAAGSIIRLYMAEVHDVETDTALAVAGPAARFDPEFVEPSRGGVGQHDVAAHHRDRSPEARYPNRPRVERKHDSFGLY